MRKPVTLAPIFLSESKETNGGHGLFKLLIHVTEVTDWDGFLLITGGRPTEGESNAPPLVKLELEVILE